nr:InlB B-repeat-containing protein [Candidatus Enterousia merdequi]
MKNILKYCAIGCALIAVNGAYGIGNGGMASFSEIRSGYTCSETPTRKNANDYWMCDGNILLCPAGYYCPDNNNGSIVCPEGKTSQAGATSEEECYYTDSVLMTMESIDTVNEELLKTFDDAVEVQTAAIFEPNTININWKDADGNTFASTTCEYDGSITAPTTAPTKKGYTFTGWQNLMIKENEQTENVVE